MFAEPPAPPPCNAGPGIVCNQLAPEDLVVLGADWVAASASFQTHALYVEAGSGPVYKMFAVAHGARESIEVFTVDTSGKEPVATWIGCAVAPEPIGINSVRGLKDGGFFTTNFQNRGEAPEAFRDIIHWASDGQLWAAGQAGQNWKVVKINLQNLTVTDIADYANEPGFGSGTAVVEVGTSLWVGSFRGDRICVIPLP